MERKGGREIGGEERVRGRGREGGGEGGRVGRGRWERVFQVVKSVELD